MCLAQGHALPFNGAVLVAVRIPPGDASEVELASRFFTIDTPTNAWKATPLFSGPVISSSSHPIEEGVWLKVEALGEVKKRVLGKNAWDFLHYDFPKLLNIDQVNVLDLEPDSAPNPLKEVYRQPTVPVLRGDRRFARLYAVRPVSRHFGWHLEDAYTELASARTRVLNEYPINPSLGPVRVAVFDTGVISNPIHLADPMDVDPSLGGNFVTSPPQFGSANDPVEHVGNSRFGQGGHGNAVASLLAGRPVTFVTQTEDFSDYMGGAPSAVVVPMRVSECLNSYRPSALATALALAVTQHLEIASISVYSLPSCAVRDAVNLAYENGVVMIASSGEYRSTGLLGPFSTTMAGYPAHFSRVMAVEAVEPDGTRFGGLAGHGLCEAFRFGLRGRYGSGDYCPHAIAAYGTAQPFCVPLSTNLIDLRASGTSLATAQVAAAAALYIQRYQWVGAANWSRAQAVYDALLATAKSGPTPILQAARAIATPPGSPVKAPNPLIGFEWFEIDVNQNKLLHARMARTELAQLAADCGYLEHVFGRKDFSKALEEKHRARFLKLISEQPSCSEFLKQQIRQQKSPARHGLQD